MSQPLPGEVAIRVYAPSDQDALEAIIRAAFAAGEISGWEPYEIENMVRGVGSTPDSTFVALAADHIVGFLASDYSMLVVSPDARRKGIGRKLVATGVANQPQLELAPPVGSIGSEQFLRAVGFAPHHLLWQLIRQEGARVEEPEAPSGFVLRVNLNLPSSIEFHSQISISTDCQLRVPTLSAILLVTAQKRSTQVGNLN